MGFGKLDCQISDCRKSQSMSFSVFLVTYCICKMRAQVTTHMVCHDVIEQCLIKMFQDVTSQRNFKKTVTAKSQLTLSNTNSISRTTKFMTIKCYSYRNTVAYLHRESKKHQSLGHNFAILLSDFQNFLTSRFRSKYATNSCLNIPPRFKHVATLPCEI